MVKGKTVHMTFKYTLLFILVYAAYNVFSRETRSAYRFIPKLLNKTFR